MIRRELTDAQWRHIEPLIPGKPGDKGRDGKDNRLFVDVGRAARATPDGYTIDLGQLNTHVLNGALYALRYDLLNDFALISPIVTTSVILYARKTMPATSRN